MIKNLIFLFGFSTFVTVVWISGTIYHNSVTSKITPADKMNIEKIEPEFDTKIIGQLEARQEVSANLEENVSIIDNESIENNGTPSARTTITPTIKPTGTITPPAISQSP